MEMGVGPPQYLRESQAREVISVAAMALLEQETGQSLTFREPTMSFLEGLINPAPR
jgi:hypothetical protein